MATASLSLDIDFAAEPPRDVKTLLADERRKLVLITLRRGAVLAAHKALHPITIHAVEGEGELRVGEERIPLTRGVVVPLDAEVMHEVEARPDLAVLVTMFRAPKSA